MKHLFSALALVAVAATSSVASPVALDYRATDASCIDASRFADEVSAKLGFVPWKPSASAKLRVRVGKDGAQFSGSFLNSDGTSKIIDGATCAEVTSRLAVTVAAAVDPSAHKAEPQPAPTPAPAPAPAVADGRIPVTFTAVDGRRVDISLQTGAGFGHASNGTGVSAVYWDKVCTSPCTARLPVGRNFLLFSEPESKAVHGDAFIIDSPTKVTLKYRSRSGSRRGWFFGGLGVTVGSTVGGIALGGVGGIVLGSLGASFGLAGMLMPLLIQDTFDATTSHGP